MRRFTAVLLLLLASLPASTQAVSSGELVQNTRDWDGKTVVFTGEAIGEAMRRGFMAWIHVNDDAYMWKNIEEGATLGGSNSGQAIWLPSDLAKRVSFFGDFAHEGDVVEVIGVFRATCPEHGGDMDIHATELRVLRAGHAVADPIDRRRVILALVMVALTGLATAGRHLRRRRGQ